MRRISPTIVCIEVFQASTNKGLRNAKKSRKTIILFRESKGPKNQGAKDVHEKVTGCMLTKLKRKQGKGMCKRIN